MDEDQKPKQTAYSIAIKPAPEVREALRRSAEAAGRTLTKEIEFRLAASVGEGQSEIDRALYGWSDKTLRRNRALGRCAGALAYRQERVAGEAGPAVLAMLKLAVGDFLDRLGANEDALTEDHRNMARASGWHLMNDLRDAAESGAAFAAIVDDLDVYRPKAKRSMGSLARHLKKKGEA